MPTVEELEGRINDLARRADDDRAHAARRLDDLERRTRELEESTEARIDEFTRTVDGFARRVAEADETNGRPLVARAEKYRVHVLGVPQGGKLLLNGEEIDVTNGVETVLELAPGQYEITARARGFHERVLTVRADAQDKRVDGQLEMTETRR